MIAMSVQSSQVLCMEQDLSGFSCQNPGCDDYQKQGRGNLRVDSFYGKTKSLRLLYCRTCRKRFSERKGSCFFGSQLPRETVTLLIQYLEQGRGIRETAKLLSINRNTVLRYSHSRRRRAEDGRAHPEASPEHDGHPPVSGP